MLFCGITLSHMNIYNLSDKGVESVRTTISTMGLIAEGLMFFLVGAYIFNVQYLTSDSDTELLQNSVSLVLLGIVLGCMIIGRIINILFISFIAYLIIGKEKWRLNIYELEIIFFSGFVKGGVPFALMLTIPFNNNNLLSTTSMIITMTYIVFFTSLFVNSLLPKIIRNRLKKIRELHHSDPEHPSLAESFL